MKPRLIFADEREEVVKRLQAGFDGCQDVTAVWLSPVDLRRLEGLDALYLILAICRKVGSETDSVQVASSQNKR